MKPGVELLSRCFISIGSSKLDIPLLYKLRHLQTELVSQSL